MISATGIGSGLDIEGLVTQLVNAERAPAENRLLRQESRLTAELSAFGTLKGALEQFQDGLSTLGDAGTFTRRSASSTDAAVVSASAGPDAAPGTLAVTGDQLILGLFGINIATFAQEAAMDPETAPLVNVKADFTFVGTLIPEPGTAILLGMGLMALGAARPTRTH